jgi:hypothetical protein
LGQKLEQALFYLGQSSVGVTWLRMEIKMEIMHELLKAKSTEATLSEFSIMRVHSHDCNKLQ